MLHDDRTAGVGTAGSLGGMQRPNGPTKPGVTGDEPNLFRLGRPRFGGA